MTTITINFRKPDATVASLPIPWAMTIKGLKTKVAENVLMLPKAVVRLIKSDGVELTNNRLLVRSMGLADGDVLQVSVVGQGGAVRKSIDKNAVSKHQFKMASTMESLKEKGGMVSDDTKAAIPAVAELERNINHALTRSSANASETLDDMAHNCTISTIEATLELLNNCGSGTAEAKVKQGGFMLFGDCMATVKSHQGSLNAAVDASMNAVLFVFQKACLDNPAYSLKSFKTMLENKLTFKKGQASASSASASASADGMQGLTQAFGNLGQ